MMVRMQLCILDCRRPIAAMGNQLQGKGVGGRRKLGLSDTTVLA